jgi:hypothetical protein
MKIIDVDRERTKIPPEVIVIDDLSVAMAAPSYVPSRPRSPPMERPEQQNWKELETPKKLITPPKSGQLMRMQALMHMKKEKGGGTQGLNRLLEYKKREKMREKDQILTASETNTSAPAKRQRDSSVFNMNVDQYLKDIQILRERREAETQKKACLLQSSMKEEQFKPLISPEVCGPMALTKEEEKAMELRIRYQNRYQLDGFYSQVLTFNVENMVEKSRPPAIPLNFEDGRVYSRFITPSYFEEVRADLENCASQIDISQATKMQLQLHHETGDILYLAHIQDAATKTSHLSAVFRHDEIVLCLLETPEVVTKVKPGVRLNPLHFLGMIHVENDGGGKHYANYFIKAKADEDLREAAKVPRHYFVVFVEYAQTMIREYRMIRLAEFLDIQFLTPTVQPYQR